ncbi:MAG: alpha-amylase [Armatimonadetes bacterium]|nr:alpha-amylase [Armatimonadota bacterium]
MKVHRMSAALAMPWTRATPLRAVSAPLAVRSGSPVACALPLPALIAPPRNQPAPPPEWSRQILYFPMTDRFYDGDPANNQGVDRGQPAGFHGGDLAGLIQKLDYVQSLGVTALWLSPMAANTQGNHHCGYHGYWIRDHNRVEEHQGDLATARRTVDEAHRRGMKVVLDVVLNHVGPDHPFLSDPARRDWFHTLGDIKDWNDQHQVENGRIAGLPDLAQENPAVYEFLLENTAWWIQQLGVDGIRLDAVKHVSKEFWQRFLPDLKARVGKDLFVVGEVLHGDPGYVAAYQRAGVDYLFDFPLCFAIRNVFGRDGSARELGRIFAQDSQYVDPSHMVTLIDNHDFSRFVSDAQGDTRARLKLALAFLMSARGLPSVYYGTEVGLEGGNDPDNRRMMEFERDPELRSYFTRVTSLRRSLPALQAGTQREMWQDDQVFAFSRQVPGQEAIAVFNNGPETARRRIPLRAESRLPDGTVLRDLLSGQTLQVRDRHLEIELASKNPMILVPEGSTPCI